MIAKKVASLSKKMPWSRNEDREKILAENNLYLAALAKKANDCLTDVKFQEYQKMFEQYQAAVIDDILALYEPDPITYAFKIRQLVDTLKAYRLLISSVQEDAARKVE